MTNTTLLKALMDALTGLTPEQQDGYQGGGENYTYLDALTLSTPALAYSKYDTIYSDTAKHRYNTGWVLADLIRVIKLEIAQTENKSKNGNAAKQHKVAEKIIKRAMQNQSAHNGCKGYWIYDGKQAVCDGYRAFLFKNIDETLPKIPENAQAFPLEQPFACKNTLHKKLETPNAALLKAYIKTHKAKYLPYHFGDIVVKAEFLLDVLETMPGCTMYMTGNGDKSYLSPIYCVDENGNEALLLPVRPEVKPEYETAEKWKLTATAYELGNEYKTKL